VHAGEKPTEVDQPEQQRRLVRIRCTVEVRDEEFAGRAHFPRDGEIARLVDRQRRQQEHDRQQQRDGDEQRQRIVATPWESGENRRHRAARGLHGKRGSWHATSRLSRRARRISRA
jgi:hypothetical protein